MSRTMRRHWGVSSRKQVVLKRRGSILVLAAFLMVLMTMLLAVSVDIGYMMTVQNEMDRAVDAAALAGAGTLVDGADAAKLEAFEFYVQNPVGKVNLVADDRSSTPSRSMRWGCAARLTSSPPSYRCAPRGAKTRWKCRWPTWCGGCICPADMRRCGLAARSIPRTSNVRCRRRFKWRASSTI